MPFIDPGVDRSRYQALHVTVPDAQEITINATARATIVERAKSAAQQHTAALIAPLVDVDRVPADARGDALQQARASVPDCTQVEAARDALAAEHPLLAELADNAGRGVDPPRVWIAASDDHADAAGRVGEQLALALGVRLIEPRALLAEAVAFPPGWTAADVARLYAAKAAPCEDGLDGHVPLLDHAVSAAHEAAAEAVHALVGEQSSLSLVGGAAAAASAASTTAEAGPAGTSMAPSAAVSARLDPGVQSWMQDLANEEYQREQRLLHGAATLHEAGVKARDRVRAAAKRAKEAVDDSEMAAATAEAEQAALGKLKWTEDDLATCSAWAADLQATAAAHSRANELSMALNTPDSALYRPTADPRSVLGQIAEAYLATGEAVPRDLVRALVRDAILEAVEAGVGYVLVGWPDSQLEYEDLLAAIETAVGVGHRVRVLAARARGKAAREWAGLQDDETAAALAREDTELEEGPAPAGAQRQNSGAAALSLSEEARDMELLAAMLAPSSAMAALAEAGPGAPELAGALDEQGKWDPASGAGPGGIDALDLQLAPGTVPAELALTAEERSAALAARTGTASAAAAGAEGEAAAGAVGSAPAVQGVQVRSPDSARGAAVPAREPAHAAAKPARAVNIREDRNRMRAFQEDAPAAAAAPYPEEIAAMRGGSSPRPRKAVDPDALGAPPCGRAFDTWDAIKEAGEGCAMDGGASWVLPVSGASQLPPELGAVQRANDAVPSLVLHVTAGNGPSRVRNEDSSDWESSSSDNEDAQDGWASASPRARARMLDPVTGRVYTAEDLASAQPHAAYDELELAKGTAQGPSPALQHGADMYMDMFNPRAWEALGLLETVPAALEASRFAVHPVTGELADWQELLDTHPAAAARALACAVAAQEHARTDQVWRVVFAQWRALLGLPDEAAAGTELATAPTSVVPLAGGDAAIALGTDEEPPQRSAWGPPAVGDGALGDEQVHLLATRWGCDVAQVEEVLAGTMGQSAEVLATAAVQRLLQRMLSKHQATLGLSCARGTPEEDEDAGASRPATASQRSTLSMAQVQAWLADLEASVAAQEAAEQAAGEEAAQEADTGSTDGKQTEAAQDLSAAAPASEPAYQPGRAILQAVRELQASIAAQLRGTVEEAGVSQYIVQRFVREIVQPAPRDDDSASADHPAEGQPGATDAAAPATPRVFPLSPAGLLSRLLQRAQAGVGVNVALAVRQLLSALGGGLLVRAAVKSERECPSSGWRNWRPLAGERRGPAAVLVRAPPLWALWGLAHGNAATALAPRRPVGDETMEDVLGEFEMARAEEDGAGPAAGAAALHAAAQPSPALLTALGLAPSVPALASGAQHGSLYYPDAAAAANALAAAGMPEDDNTDEGGVLAARSQVHAPWWWRPISALDAAEHTAHRASFAAATLWETWAAMPAFEALVVAGQAAGSDAGAVRHILSQQPGTQPQRGACVPPVLVEFQPGHATQCHIDAGWLHGLAEATAKRVAKLGSAAAHAAPLLPDVGCVRAVTEIDASLPSAAAGLAALLAVAEGVLPWASRGALAPAAPQPLRLPDAAPAWPELEDGSDAQALRAEAARDVAYSMARALPLAALTGNVREFAPRTGDKVGAVAPASEAADYRSRARALYWQRTGAPPAVAAEEGKSHLVFPDVTVAQSSLPHSLSQELLPIVPGGLDVRPLVPLDDDACSKLLLAEAPLPRWDPEVEAALDVRPGWAVHVPACASLPAAGDVVGNAAGLDEESMHGPGGAGPSWVAPREWAPLTNPAQRAAVAHDRASWGSWLMRLGLWAASSAVLQRVASSHVAELTARADAAQAQLDAAAARASSKRRAARAKADALAAKQAASAMKRKGKAAVAEAEAAANAAQAEEARAKAAAAQASLAAIGQELAAARAARAERSPIALAAQLIAEVRHACSAAAVRNWRAWFMSGPALGAAAAVALYTSATRGEQAPACFARWVHAAFGVPAPPVDPESKLRVSLLDDVTADALVAAARRPILPCLALANDGTDSFDLPAAAAALLVSYRDLSSSMARLLCTPLGGSVGLHSPVPLDEDEDDAAGLDDEELDSTHPCVPLEWWSAARARRHDALLADAGQVDDGADALPEQAFYAEEREDAALPRGSTQVGSLLSSSSEDAWYDGARTWQGVVSALAARSDEQSVPPVVQPCEHNSAAIAAVRGMPGVPTVARDWRAVVRLASKVRAAARGARQAVQRAARQLSPWAWTCPVTWAESGQVQLGLPQHAVSWRGYTFVFASAEAKRLFIACPSRWLRPLSSASHLPRGEPIAAAWPSLPRKPRVAVAGPSKAGSTTLAGALAQAFQMVQLGLPELLAGSSGRSGTASGVMEEQHLGKAMAKPGDASPEHAQQAAAAAAAAAAAVPAASNSSSQACHSSLKYDSQPDLRSMVQAVLRRAGSLPPALLAEVLCAQANGTPAQAEQSARLARVARMAAAVLQVRAEAVASAQSLGQKISKRVKAGKTATRDAEDTAEEARVSAVKLAADAGADQLARMDKAIAELTEWSGVVVPGVQNLRVAEGSAQADAGWVLEGVPCSVDAWLALLRRGVLPDAVVLLDPTVACIGPAAGSPVSLHPRAAALAGLEGACPRDPTSDAWGAHASQPELVAAASGSEEAAWRLQPDSADASALWLAEAARRWRAALHDGSSTQAAQVPSAPELRAYLDALPRVVALLLRVGVRVSLVPAGAGFHAGAVAALAAAAVDPFMPRTARSTWWAEPVRDALAAWDAVTDSQEADEGRAAAAKALSGLPPTDDVPLLIPGPQLAAFQAIQKQDLTSEAVLPLDFGTHAAHRAAAVLTAPEAARASDSAEDMLAAVRVLPEQLPTDTVLQLPGVGLLVLSSPQEALGVHVAPWRHPDVLAKLPPAAARAYASRWAVLDAVTSDQPAELLLQTPGMEQGAHHATPASAAGAGQAAARAPVVLLCGPRNSLSMRAAQDILASPELATNVHVVDALPGLLGLHRPGAQPGSFEDVLWRRQVRAVLRDAFTTPALYAAALQGLALDQLLSEQELALETLAPGGAALRLARAAMADSHALAGTPASGVRLVQAWLEELQAHARLCALHDAVQDAREAIADMQCLKSPPTALLQQVQAALNSMALAPLGPSPAHFRSSGAALDLVNDGDVTETLAAAGEQDVLTEMPIGPDAADEDTFSAVLALPDLDEEASAELLGDALGQFVRELATTAGAARALVLHGLPPLAAAAVRRSASQCSAPLAVLPLLPSGEPTDAQLLADLLVQPHTAADEAVDANAAPQSGLDAYCLARSQSEVQWRPARATQADMVAKAREAGQREAQAELWRAVAAQYLAEERAAGVQRHAAVADSEADLARELWQQFAASRSKAARKLAARRRRAREKRRDRGEEVQSDSDGEDAASVHSDAAAPWVAEEEAEPVWDAAVLREELTASLTTAITLFQDEAAAYADACASIADEAPAAAVTLLPAQQLRAKPRRLQLATALADVVPLARALRWQPHRGQRRLSEQAAQSALTAAGASSYAEFIDGQRGAARAVQQYTASPATAWARCEGSAAIGSMLSLPTAEALLHSGAASVGMSGPYCPVAAATQGHWVNVPACAAGAGRGAAGLSAVAAAILQGELARGVAPGAAGGVAAVLARAAAPGLGRTAAGPAMAAALCTPAAWPVLYRQKVYWCQSCSAAASFALCPELYLAAMPRAPAALHGVVGDASVATQVVQLSTSSEPWAVQAAAECAAPLVTGPASLAASVALRALHPGSSELAGSIGATARAIARLAGGSSEQRAACEPSSAAVRLHVGGAALPRAAPAVPATLDAAGTGLAMAACAKYCASLGRGYVLNVQHADPALVGSVRRGLGIAAEDLAKLATSARRAVPLSRLLARQPLAPHLLLYSAAPVAAAQAAAPCVQLGTAAAQATAGALPSRLLARAPSSALPGADAVEDAWQAWQSERDAAIAAAARCTQRVREVDDPLLAAWVGPALQGQTLPANIAMEGALADSAGDQVEDADEAEVPGALPKPRVPECADDEAYLAWRVAWQEAVHDGEALLVPAEDVDNAEPRASGWPHAAHAGPRGLWPAGTGAVATGSAQAEDEDWTGEAAYVTALCWSSSAGSREPDSWRPVPARLGEQQPRSVLTGGALPGVPAPAHELEQWNAWVPSAASALAAAIGRACEIHAGPAMAAQVRRAVQQLADALCEAVAGEETGSPVSVAGLPVPQPLLSACLHPAWSMSCPVSSSLHGRTLCVPVCVTAAACGMPMDAAPCELEPLAGWDAVRATQALRSRAVAWQGHVWLLAEPSSAVVAMARARDVLLSSPPSHMVAQYAAVLPDLTQLLAADAGALGSPVGALWRNNLGRGASGDAAAGIAPWPLPGPQRSWTQAMERRRLLALAGLCPVSLLQALHAPAHLASSLDLAARLQRVKWGSPQFGVVLQDQVWLCSDALAMRAVLAQPLQYAYLTTPNILPLRLVQRRETVYVERPEAPAVHDGAMPSEPAPLELLQGWAAGQLPRGAQAYMAAAVGPSLVRALADLSRSPSHEPNVAHRCHPGMTARGSVLTWLALHLRAHNPRSGLHERARAKRQLQRFSAECELSAALLDAASEDASLAAQPPGSRPVHISSAAGGKSGVRTGRQLVLPTAATRAAELLERAGHNPGPDSVVESGLSAWHQAASAAGVQDLWTRLCVPVSNIAAASSPSTSSKGSSPGQHAAGIVQSVVSDALAGALAGVRSASPALR